MLDIIVFLYQLLLVLVLGFISLVAIFFILALVFLCSRELVRAIFKT